MRLKLTRSLKSQIKRIGAFLLVDIVDGDIDEVQPLVAALRALADALEEQNNDAPL
jgi:hypothetical protein